MTVAELIKELQKYKQDLSVYLAYDNGTGSEVIRVFKDVEYCGNRSITTIYLSEDEEV